MVNSRAAAVADRLEASLAEGRVKLAREAREKGRDVTRDDERLWAESHMRSFLEDQQTEAYSGSLVPLDESEVSWIKEQAKVRVFDGGPLFQAYERFSTATNISVIGSQRIRVELADGSIEFHGPVAKSSEDLARQVRSQIGPNGIKDVEWDPLKPELELILPDGGRLTALRYVGEEVFVTIRRPTLARVRLGELVGNGTMSPRAGSFLAAMGPALLRFMVGGSMNSGKTVLLRAIAASMPASWQVLTIESQAELLLHKYPDVYPEFVYAMEAKKPNSQGEGEITVGSLIQHAQRGSPSMVIVGETRGPDDAAAYLRAITQGYPVCGTIHAHSSLDAVYNLAQYYEEGTGASYESAVRRAARAIDVAIHMRQLSDGRRVLNSIRLIERADGNGVVVSEELWRPQRDGAARMEGTESVIGREFLDRMVACGFDPSLSDVAEVSR